MELRIGKSLVKLVKGDITHAEVDAIVNAANKRLKMGGGVAGAILRRGGYSIQRECDKIGCCPVGEAVVTSAGRLKAKYVIHAVGPRMGEGDEEEKLRRATLNSLMRAEEKRLTSIAFPAISTGVFRVPKELSAEAMLSTILNYLSTSKTKIRKVYVYLYDEDTYKVFEKTLNRLIKA